MSKSLITHFSIIKDPRVQGKTRHLLIDILIIAVCAVIGGAEGWEDIETFAKSKEKWFRQFLKLPNGIPAHDTISRVLQRVDPDEFRKVFVKWVKSVREKIGKEVIAIDGKTSRRTQDRRNGHSPLHTVSAWAKSNRLVLAQMKVDEKSNEIKAIPEILKLLEIKNCIVTLDAMGTQKNIARKIIVREADYVLALKNNQKGLYEDVSLYFQEAIKNNFKEEPHEYYETVEKGHGRLEKRQYWLVTEIDWLKLNHDWHGLESIGMVRSQREIDGNLTEECRYYITSLTKDVKEFAEAVRSHWSVENSLHWVLDVVFREDESRIRKGNGAENMTMLRHLAINLLKQSEEKLTKKYKKMSMRKKRLRCGWDSQFLADALFS